METRGIILLSVKGWRVGVIRSESYNYNIAKRRIHSFVPLFRFLSSVSTQTTKKTKPALKVLYNLWHSKCERSYDKARKSADKLREHITLLVRVRHAVCLSGLATKTKTTLTSLLFSKIIYSVPPLNNYQLRFIKIKQETGKSKP